MPIITNPKELKKLFGSTPNLIDDVEVDLIISESPSYDNTITERPVEAGLDVTDMKVRKPTGLSLSCIFTDTPKDIKTIITTAATGTLNFDKWRDKWTSLKEKIELKTVITVVTPLDTYYNMILVSCNPNVTASSGDALFFDCIFKEVRFVSSEIADVDEDAIPKEKKKKAKKKKNKDKDKKKESEKNQGSKKSKSVLKSGVEKIGKLFTS